MGENINFDKIGEEIEKHPLVIVGKHSCWNCENRDLGWRIKPSVEAPYEYTCKRKGEHGGYFTTLLLDRKKKGHGYKTKEEIEKKLKSMGKDCKKWRERITYVKVR